MEENNDMSSYVPYIFVIVFLTITFIACWKYASQDIKYTNRIGNTEEELLPCPFCGSNNIIVRELQKCIFYAHCDNCGSDSKSYDKCSFCEVKDCKNSNNCPSEALKDAKLCAIRDWNRRVNE